jgi:flagellar biosynthesis component FlhA
MTTLEQIKLVHALNRAYLHAAVMLETADNHDLREQWIREQFREAAQILGFTLIDENNTQPFSLGR